MNGNYSHDDKIHVLEELPPPPPNFTKAVIKVMFLDILTKYIFVVDFRPN